MPESHIPDGLIAVEVLHPRLEVNVQVAPSVVVIERTIRAAFRMHQAIRVRDLDIDAADGGDKIFGRVHAEHDVTVEPWNAQELRDNGLRFGDAAVRLRLIDLLLTAARVRRDHVARNGKLIDVVRYEVEIDRPNDVAARLFGILFVFGRVVVIQPFHQDQNIVLMEHRLRRRCEYRRDDLPHRFALRNRHARQQRDDAGDDDTGNDRHAFEYGRTRPHRLYGIFGKQMFTHALSGHGSRTRSCARA